MTQEKSSESHGKSKFTLITFILGVITVVVFIAVLGWFLRILQRDMIGSEVFLILGILIPIIILIVGLVLELKRKISPKKTLLLSLGSFLLTGLIAIAAIGFDLNLEMENLQHFQFVVFMVVLALVSILCILIYGTIKVRLRPSHLKITTILFAVFSLIFLIGNGVFIGLVNTQVFVGTIHKGTGYTEGPWATWQGNTNDSITITWLTAEKNSSKLMYGTDPNNLNLIFSDPVHRNLHKAVLTGLQPNTTYYYRIPENFVTNHSTSLFQFRTSSSASTYMRFAVVGDKQPTSEDLLRSNGFVADGIIAGNYDFVCQVGDLAGAGTEMGDWHNTFQSLARIGARSPLMMAIGNHDWNGIQGAANWRQLFSYDLVSPMGASYYSFDYGNAHFVMIDNFELFYRMSEAQLKWIEQDITKAKAQGKWVFTFFHLSIMTTATSGFYDGLQRQLVPIFDRTGVDAVFYGHDHHYEHYNYTYGTNDLVFSESDIPSNKSVQYFCTGGGGANLEVSYGVLEMGNSKFNVERFNRTSQQYQNVVYEKRAWNASRYVTNPGFAINYTQYSETGKHDGKYYYHAPEIEAYANFTTDYGFTYSEQAYHFMDIEINGDQCIIRAVYPNGQVLSGPNGAYKQEFILQKK
jgi:3',5'-cyclic AMP phosphodiesterase CpdA